MWCQGATLKQEWTDQGMAQPTEPTKGCQQGLRRHGED
jgi:hypothetical protein